MIEAVVLLALQTSPAPQPSATPLKTIIEITARPLCTALHHMVMPFVTVEKQNSDQFVVMDKQLTRYRSWDTNVLSDTGQQGTYTANGELNLNAAKLDQEASLIYQRVAGVEKQLAQSYHDAPVGKDPALDELRARMDNIAKLQYALAAKYDLVAGRTLNAGALPPALASVSAGAVPDYNNSNPLDYTTPAPARAVATPGATMTAVTKDLMFNTPTATVQKALHAQELGFIAPALGAVRACDGP